MKFAPIIYPSISYHCVGVRFSDTHVSAKWVITSQVVVIGVVGEAVGGLNIGVLNGGGRRIKPRDHVMDLCGP